jgi:hypothetical protein
MVDKIVRKILADYIELSIAGRINDKMKAIMVAELRGEITPEVEEVLVETPEEPEVVEVIEEPTPEPPPPVEDPAEIIKKEKIAKLKAELAELEE